MGRVLILAFALLVAACGPPDRVEPTNSERKEAVNEISLARLPAVGHTFDGRMSAVETLF